MIKDHILEVKKHLSSKILSRVEKNILIAELVLASNK